VARRRSVASTVTALTLSAALYSAAATALESEASGPDVTIIAGEQRTIYEYRQAGQLRIIKVVPKHAPPYYLVPRDETRGFGDLEQADMLIARWKIIEF
jgi:hypothetical protein